MRSSLRLTSPSRSSVYNARPTDNRLDSTSGVDTPAEAPPTCKRSSSDETRSGEWSVDPGFGVYVHIPFCKHRCHYCDFNTYEGQDALHGEYVDALVRSIERWSPGREVPEATSVFFGGGTPTLLSVEQLARVLGAVERRVGLARGAEVTIEANPETVNEAVFGGLLGAGFNRFSIGVQSLAPHVLAGLGRTHSSQGALDAAAAARQAGVEDLNLDLIYGSPWETDGDWDRTLAGVVAAAPDHLSVYALTVEEGTPLHTLVATGRVPDPDPDVQASRYEVALEVLGAAGYGRYEVSNWARPGRSSRHNVLYWCAGDYLAFGAGAHGHLDGIRWWNERLPRDFIARADDPIAGSEHLDRSEQAREALMLGLRLRSGVDLAAFETRFGGSLAALLAERIPGLQGAGLLEIESGNLRIPDRRVFVANDVLCRLLAA
jgi:putative oxygen-independent coproporphyrinogen III oxidase